MKSKAKKKLAKLLGGEYNKFGDGSSEWVILKSDSHQVEFYFGEEGELDEVCFCKRVFEEIEPDMLSRIIFSKGGTQPDKNDPNNVDSPTHGDYWRYC